VPRIERDVAHEPIDGHPVAGLLGRTS
jgi:hypothetical protein